MSRERSRPASRRAARRQTERREARSQPAGDPPPLHSPDVAPLGRGVAASIPGRYDQGATGQPPPKRPGRHRWVITACYAVAEETVAGEAAGDRQTFLDHESRFALALGCWDCEQQYPEIEPGSPCPASAWEDQ